MSTDRNDRSPQRTGGTETGGTGPTLRWDDSRMRSSYANACNVVSTREEVVLFFGLNQGWRSDANEITVQIEERIILTPHAAKRLSLMLTNVLREHENRFGEIALDIRPPAGTTAQ